MEFRLTYEGKLFATQRDPLSGQRDARADHKHDLRRVFHRQLRVLWGSVPFLKNAERSGSAALILGGPTRNLAPKYDIDTLKKRHAKQGFNFVPLVTEELELICGLDVLFLRREKPGRILQSGSGDLDNRLKTLFDALRIPSGNEGYSNRKPAADEDPFFCLLQDDKLITRAAVETDVLLEDVDDRPDANDARLVIAVKLRPFEMTLDNMQFG